MPHIPPSNRQDEPRYAGEARELQAAARQQSEKARQQNAAAMAAVLAAGERACLEGYKAGMEEGLGEAPVLESVVEGLHKPALSNVRIRVDWLIDGLIHRLT